MKRPVKISARQLSRLIKEATGVGMNGPDVLLQHAYDEIESLRTNLIRLKASKFGSDPGVAEALRDAVTSAIVAMSHISDASNAITASQ